MSAVEIEFMPLAHGADIDLPHYATPEAAGMDIRAACPQGAPINLAPGEQALVPSGFAMAMPKGYEAQIRPRSGLAAKHGVTVLNAPGTIDSDYRGEVKILLINHGNAPFTIARGARIAQMVIAPIVQVQTRRVAALDKSQRGESGFGSTGT